MRLPNKGMKQTKPSILELRSLSPVFGRHSRSAMTRLVLVWAIVGVLLAVTGRVADEYLWILAAIPLLVWAVVGLALLIVAILHARDPGGRRRTVAHIATICGVVVLFPTLTRLGDEVTTQIRFALERSEYDQIVAKAVQGTQPIGETRSGRTVVVDPGPPIRVAFVWPGGIVDNWSGVVYDPTGEVTSVNHLTLGSNEWRSAAITKLFDGDMVYCRKLEHPYYFCSFT